MYNTIKAMIQRKRFKSLDDCLSKLAAYLAADLITDDEFFDLVTMAREVYA